MIYLCCCCFYCYCGCFKPNIICLCCCCFYCTFCEKFSDSVRFLFIALTCVCAARAERAVTMRARLGPAPPAGERQTGLVAPHGLPQVKHIQILYPCSVLNTLLCVRYCCAAKPFCFKMDALSRLEFRVIACLHPLASELNFRLVS